ncbi:MAG: hypothetical protein LBI87_10360 [Candidatus Accumulibacter sp.]|jgi:hypothetical protein|nr:hypothetical protein [Accumulibacter sp.]
MAGILFRFLLFAVLAAIKAFRFLFFAVPVVLAVVNDFRSRLSSRSPWLKSVLRG